MNIRPDEHDYWYTNPIPSVVNNKKENQMKSIIAIAALLLSITACITTKPKAIPLSEHEKTIGSVRVTYDNDGNWIKLESTGVAPLHNKSTHSLSEASKIASMYAKQNISEFLSNSFNSTHTADISSESRIQSAASSVQEDGDLNTITILVDHLREDSSQILKGVYIKNQVISEDQVSVDVEVSKQSIAASLSISSQISGASK
jgi:hypothetical protein